ncbi:hypothetical protein [Chryseobacterium sp.]|uniref:hypothetical protein n=1 Tax=Chryseobacterium sp. TaxID=1871047 RepID=UPI0011C7F39C|nr:hypothetical protein [Chryseobacterium sp.]TXF79125.1 hypothetical protein FUA25_01660 [Chryseobacterium sp.]
MKKILTMALIGGLFAASCSKKENTYQQDSNTMLAEPEVTVSDTAQTTSDKASLGTPMPKADSTAVNDSAAVK